MPVTETEILLNLSTGEVRQNVISTDKAFRIHDGFTEADREAGWKQVGNLGSGYSQAEIDAWIADIKTLNLKSKSAY